MSRDHNLEARVVLFLRADDARRDEVTALMDGALPELFEGRPTKVSVTTIRDYVRDLLGLDPGVDLAAGLTARDWLGAARAGSGDAHLGRGLPRRHRPGAAA